MRASCNGCRVLRKGCADDCTIRPCLAWIRSPDAQANATVFLAKFYGRAGLINLLAAAPDDAQRPALFRSLLYEACGRAANPVFGASGLFSTGNWEACQAAVQAVLEGRPIPQVAADQAAPHPGLLAAYGVRHIPKDGIDRASAALRASRASFKRASSSSSTARPERNGGLGEETAGSSHDHAVEDDGEALADKQKRVQSFSSEAEAGSHVSQAEQSASAPVPQVAQDDGEIDLELTLGFGPAARVLTSPPARFEASRLSTKSGHAGLLLGLPA
ncbi:LOB domain-containing protein 41-like [Triticum dicoccoides]|uniref:LOB domain-containing protein 41-like n=1 Tax=Triticum dicoccoides TaxID=85692 RepID=UPI001890366A|nr:LOB domain-containing protein 41-like [Triticum dicoccoides]